MRRVFFLLKFYFAFEHSSIDNPWSNFAFVILTVLTSEVVLLFVHALLQSRRHVLGSGTKNCWLRKHRIPNIKCLDIHLKTIVLESYLGTVSEVKFVSFFVRNARVLESMTIQVKSIDKEFIAKQQRLLQVENKASGCAQFHFTTDRCLQDIGDISNVRDLKLTDPFVR